MLGEKTPLASDDTLYYLHIPKCAGTTLIGILEEHFTNNEIYSNHYYIEELEKISDEELNSYKFIRGHFPYNTIVPRLYKKPKMITFLREPITRFVSNFQMRKRIYDPKVTREKEIRVFETLQILDFEEFLGQEWMMNIFANRTTKYISGKNDLTWDYSERTDSDFEILQMAKDHIEYEMIFLGLQERFDESLKLLSWVFDFPEVKSYEYLNVSPNRSKRNEIPDEVLERAREINWADVELYEYAKKLYEEQKIKIINELGDDDTAPTYSDGKNGFCDFSRVSPGQGWHVGEVHDIYKVIRWSGPTLHSNLFFNLSSEVDYKLLFHVVSAPSWEMLESLAVKVNGVEIELDRKLSGKEGKYQFEGLIPASLITNDTNHTIITFSISDTIVEEEGISPDKKRNIGLCYDWILVYPI